MSVGQAIAYKRAVPCVLVSTNRVKTTMNRRFDKGGKKGVKKKEGDGDFLTLEL